MIAVISLLYLFAFVTSYIGPVFQEQKEPKETHDYAIVCFDDSFKHKHMCLFSNSASSPRYGRKFTMETQWIEGIAVISGYALCLILFVVEETTHIITDDVLLYISIAILFVLLTCFIKFTTYVSKNVRKITEYTAISKETEQTVMRICRNKIRSISKENPECRCEVNVTTEKNFMWVTRSFWVCFGSKPTDRKLIACEKQFRYAAKPCYFVQ